MVLNVNSYQLDVSQLTIFQSFLKAFRREAQHASATTAAEQHRQELENLKSQSSVEVGGSLMK